MFNIFSRVHIIRSNILQFYYKLWGNNIIFSFRYWICQILCKNGRVFQNDHQSTGTIAAVLYEACMKLLLKVSFCFLKDYMPFSDIYNSTFKNEAEYRQLLIQTATALQTNKFMQVRERHVHLPWFAFKPVKPTSRRWIHFSNSVNGCHTKKSFRWHARRVCTERDSGLAWPWLKADANCSSGVPFAFLSATATTLIMSHIWWFFLSFKPLLVRKNELDKLRKDIKEQWQKEQKKMVCYQPS